MLFQLKTSLEMKQRNLQNIICLLIFTVFMIRSFLLDYFPPLMRSYCSMSDRAAQHKQLKYPLQQAKFTRSITPVTLQMRWGLELICVWEMLCPRWPLTESNMPAQAHIMSTGHMIKLTALSANDGLSFCQTLCTAHDPLKGH